MTTRFLSLFSGIEAASLAWTPLGWECVAFAEVDPFACAVLAHHYPDVPNLGDVTRIMQPELDALGRIDLVVAGFPCTDVSIAGKRAGLEKDGERTRSGLFWEAARIVRACGARWTVLENVPGLFSSHRGRDFAAVVGALAGCAFDAPDGGWRTAGVAAGPDGLVEWAVLDAQFFGLAQRRARVFLVRDSGVWADRPPVLLEPESLRGDSPPRREAREGVARPLAGGAAGGSGYRLDADTAENLIAGTVRTRNCDAGGGARSDGDAMLVTHALKAEGADASEDGTGRGVPLVAMARNAHANRLDAESEMLIPAAFNWQSGGDGRGLDPQPTSGALSRGQTPAVAFMESQSGCREYDKAGTLRAEGPGHDPVGTRAREGLSVRRLTPRECERLQGFPDDWTRVPVRQVPAKAQGKQRALWEAGDERFADIDGVMHVVAADGPRYRAIGNSMAVPCMRWIGERIMAAVGHREAR